MLQTQELEPNLIPAAVHSDNQVVSTHGGSRRGSGRKPAADPAEPRRIPKSKTDANLRVLTLTEEQANWRKLLKTVDTIAVGATDYKTKLDAANVHLDALKAISELRRGRSYVAAPPQQETNNELAQLLRGLIPGDVKRQRKAKPVDASTGDTSPEAGDLQPPADPSSQKDPG